MKVAFVLTETCVVKHKKNADKTTKWSQTFDSLDAAKQMMDILTSVYQDIVKLEPNVHESMTYDTRIVDELAEGEDKKFVPQLYHFISLADPKRALPSAPKVR